MYTERRECVLSAARGISFADFGGVCQKAAVIPFQMQKNEKGKMPTTVI